MLEGLRKFMAGRYGFDKLGQALMIAAAILMMLAGIFTSKVLVALSYAAAVWCIFRILSKNIVYRTNENRKYNILVNYLKAYFRRDRKNYRYFYCPKCKKVTKVPKHRGKIAITCPHCRHEFIKKT